LDILNGTGEGILTVKYKLNLRSGDNMELNIWNNCTKLSKVFFLLHVIKIENLLLSNRKRKRISQKTKNIIFTGKFGKSYVEYLHQNK
jgi:hypothetical protein